MKTIFDMFYFVPVCVSIYGLIAFMNLKKRLDVIDQDYETIMKTQLVYMESLEMHHKRIETIDDTLEKIALSLPYKGTGWQTPYIEAKLDREMKHHFYDDEYHDDEK